MFNRIRLPAVAACLLLLLAACGGEKDTEKGDSGETGSAVTVSDAWVKATDTEMTGVFGQIHNDTDAEITVSKASSTVAKMVEIHEVVDDGSGTMVMQPKPGGLVIPAGETATLEPGADHIMLMGLTEPLQPGDTVSVELELSDGTTTTFEATVKAFTGADESYQPSADPHESMESESPAQ